MARCIAAFGIGLLAMGCGTSSPDPVDTTDSDFSACRHRRAACDAGNGSETGADADVDAGTDAAGETGAPHSVVLTWTASVDPGVTYNAYRSEGCSGTYVMQSSGLKETSWTDLLVTSGQTYCYVTTAVDANGESVDSNTAQAVVP